jgi:hypothetical protein
VRVSRIKKISKGLVAFAAGTTLVAAGVFGGVASLANAADLTPNPTATTVATPEVTPTADPAPVAAPEAPSKDATQASKTEAPTPAPANTTAPTDQSTKPAVAAKVTTDTLPAPPVSNKLKTETSKKVFVCKYVGTPGVDERLQTGQNPISVSVNSIQHNQWDGTVPGYFSDAHDRSYVLAYDTGQTKPDVSACPTPVVPPVETCVKTPSYSYTFDSATGSGIVTVTGGKAGATLCAPLAVRAVVYTYDLPASGSPSWPQTRVGFNDTTVDKVGTFHYGPPQITTCRQYDVYASFNGFGALAVPEHLLGSHNPYEPAFLSETLAGNGPNPTYSTTTSEGCNPPPPPKVIKPVATISSGECYYNAYGDLSFKPVNLTFDNSASSVPVEFVVSTPNGDLSRTVPAGESVTVKAQDTYQAVSYEVTAGGQTFALNIPAFESCAPVGVTTVTPQDVWFHDSCGITDDSTNVPGTLDPTSVDHYTDKDGNAISVSQYVVDNVGGYSVFDKVTPAGVHTSRVTFQQFGNATITEPVAGVNTYKLVHDGEVIYAEWDYTFDSTPCPPTVIATPPVLVVVAPTCSVDGSLPTLTGGENYTAAYGRVFDGPGTYPVVLTANSGFVFSAGSTVSYDLTVKGKTGNCPTTTPTPTPTPTHPITPTGNGGANTGASGSQPGASSISASNSMTSVWGIGGLIAAIVAAIIGMFLFIPRKRNRNDGGVEAA